LILLGLLKDDKNITFSSEKLKWIGSIDDYSSDVGLVILRNEVPFEFDKIILGENAETKIYEIPTIFHRVIDNKSSKLIYGYKGKDELVLAFMRGELNSFAISHSNLLNRYNINDIYSMSRPVLQYGHNQRSLLYRDVPTFYEVAKTAEQKVLVDFLQMTTYINKPLHMGSEVADWKVDIVRKAFDKACKDVKLIEEMTKFHFPVNCISGERVTEVVTERHSTLAETGPLLRKYFQK
jgi:hypothetical protein